MLESKVCVTSHEDTESLLRAVKKAWKEIDEEVLHAVLDALSRRLNKCVCAKACHFEIQLLLYMCKVDSNNYCEVHTIFFKTAARWLVTYAQQLLPHSVITLELAT